MKNNESSSQVHSNYYLDIDLYQMKGIKEMSIGDIYGPYIRIDSISKDHRNVVFHYDNSTIYSADYKYNGSCWQSFHFVDDHDEGAIFYFYEFVCKENIIKIEYKGDPSKDGFLVSVKKVEDGKILEYVFDEEDAIKLKPTYEINTYPLGKSVIKRITTYEIKNGFLSFHKKTIEGLTNEVMSESDDCYVVNEFSYFWWSFIGYKLKKSDC